MIGRFGIGARDVAISLVASGIIGLAMLADLGTDPSEEVKPAPMEAFTSLFDQATVGIGLWMSPARARASVSAM